MLELQSTTNHGNLNTVLIKLNQYYECFGSSSRKQDFLLITHVSRW